MTCVLLATPAYDGKLAYDYVQSLLETVSLFGQHDINLKYLCWPNCSVLPWARNKIASLFLGDEAASHLLMVDADVSWQAPDVLRLLGHGLPLVAGIYGKRGQQIAATGLSLDVDRQRGLIRFDHIGLGFVLVARDALQTMCDVYGRARGFTDAECEGGATMMVDLYPVGPAADGKYVGEDVGHCRLLTDLGGEIWADPSVRLTHCGVTLDATRYFAEQLQPPADPDRTASIHRVTVGSGGPVRLVGSGG